MEPSDLPVFLYKELLQIYSPAAVVDVRSGVDVDAGADAGADAEADGIAAGIAADVAAAAASPDGVHVGQFAEYYVRLIEAFGRLEALF